MRPSRPALALLVVLVLAGTVGAVPVASHPSPAASPPPTPLPPAPGHLTRAPRAASVDPTALYDREPAPMGIGDFGVDAEGHAYEYNTSAFLGNFSWQSLAISGANGTSFTVQLNVVLQFVHGGTTYAYWIQDVAFMDTDSRALTFENNIWNFSSPSGCLDASGVRGNGSVNAYEGCVGFYATLATDQPGASLDMPSPGDFGLLVRSYETAGGYPGVAFEYWDGVTSWYVTYDNVEFPWAHDPTSDPGFVVDGLAYNPLGLFYDAELTLGGPGGGEGTALNSVTATSMRLLDWNGHDFAAVPSAWNFGSNTAEAVTDAQSIGASDAYGLPLTVQRNGTTRDAAPGPAYNTSEVGALAVSAPGIAAGTLAVGADTEPFVNGSANVTLVPGSYPVWVNASGASYPFGLCRVGGGAVTQTSVSTGCGPLLAAPVPDPSGGIDLGQSVVFAPDIESSGSGGDTYAWSVTPSGLGCGSPTGATLDCSPTATGTFRLNLTVTDSDHRSSTSPNLTYLVAADPQVGAPAASPASAETGGTVAFSVAPTGGRLPLTYLWTDLPTPCTGTATATVDCTPQTAGTYDVQVEVTDASGLTSTSPITAYAVAPGPAVTTPTIDPAATIDPGTPITLGATASGGSGGYAYAWQGLPPGCASASTATLACQPRASGTFEVTVTVTDEGGGRATSAPATLTVEPPRAVGPVAANRTAVDVGETVAFAATAATGGLGPYTYAWTGLPDGCASANAAQLVCRPTGRGSGALTVTVDDALGDSANASLDWQVASDPTLGGIAGPSSVDLGLPLALNASGLTGGVGPYSFVWSGLPAGCAPANRSYVRCVPTAAGTAPVTLVVVDATGAVATAARSVVVDPLPVVGPPTSDPASGTVGSTFAITAAASGGSGTYTYTWSGLPPGCASANVSALACRPTAAGTFSVSVTVTDSNGGTATSATLALVVRAVPAPTFLGLPATEGYALVAVALGAAVGTAIVLVRRRARA